MEKPHVARAVAEAVALGAKVEDESRAKFVAISIEGKSFYVLGNDVTPTFAFHPKHSVTFDALGIVYKAGRHSSLRDFPKVAKSSQNECLRLHSTSDLSRALDAIK